MNQLFSAPLYRNEFSQVTGVAFLRETDYEVHLVNWRPVTAELRRSLRSVHGKELVFHRVQERDAVALVATGNVTSSHPTVNRAQRDSTESDRLRNLSPEDDLLRTILAQALRVNASDISLWPSDRLSWTVTVRTKGKLQHQQVLPTTVATRIVRRVMTLSGMDLLNHTSPQNGMLRVPWFPHRRFRAAVVGTAADRHESAQIVAIRILARTVPFPPALGYTPVAMREIFRALRRGTGMVLFAGPTGSGKTTGIASFLSVLSDSGRKIVTLEDPVEYRLPGVVQIERDRSIGAELIAAAMRQDPDLIVLGETRTASHGEQLAEALLTGHQVVSSVHAGSLETVRNRMVQLGVPADQLAAHTCLVVCQRLIGEGRELHADLHPSPWKGTCHA